MSEMLEFTTKPKGDDDAAGTAAGEPPVFGFKLDGVEYFATKPKDALIAQLAPINSRRTPVGLKVKLALDFLGDAVIEPGRSVLEGRLLSADDELDVEDVMPILEAMGDFWKQFKDQQKAAKKR